MGMLLNFLRWVFEKFAAAALIGVLALTACGLWIFLKDRVDFDLWRQELIRTVDGERSKVRAAMADVELRMARLSAEMAAEDERGRQADKVLAQLKELESAWDRWVGNPEQQKTNTERAKQVAALRGQITTKRAELQREFTRTTWERDGLAIALGKVEAKYQAVVEQKSKFRHYFDRTWEYEIGRGPIRMALKWWLLTAMLLYFFGPTIWKLGLFYLVAPYIARSRPVRLQPGGAELPGVGASGVAAEITLAPGERLWVKEKFLQASDEGLERRTRSLLDWRVPLTCLATGLVELIEMKNAAGEGGAERRLTLSNQADPHSELAVITLPVGTSLILRPSFLAGVVLAADSRVQIRRRWQLFRWQAWVTLQFRFFEFVGPCRLLVAGKRGVRAERLQIRGDDRPARRTNQDATMGFTPGLDYRPARAETFWSYYRGMNPLFDDLFAGQGIFLCQQVADGEGNRQARRFWSVVWSGTLKVFGM
jgi:uncharacterized protein (AIM24 family)